MSTKEKKPSSSFKPDQVEREANAQKRIEAEKKARKEGTKPASS